MKHFDISKMVTPLEHKLDSAAYLESECLRNCLENAEFGRAARHMRRLETFSKLMAIADVRADKWRQQSIDAAKLCDEQVAICRHNETVQAGDPMKATYLGFSTTPVDWEESAQEWEARAQEWRTSAAQWTRSEEKLI